MSAAFWLTHGPLVLYCLSAFGLGWAARELAAWRKQWRDNARIAKNRRAVLAEKALGTWTVIANSEAEALALFHRYSPETLPLLGVEGRL